LEEVDNRVKWENKNFLEVRGSVFKTADVVVIVYYG
jgi:hypothetical protein